MPDDIKTTAFRGLEISVGSFDDGTPRCRDTDLGKFLGYSRPRDIRKQIESAMAAGLLNDSDIRAVVARVPTGVASVEVTEYWLTEEAALFVAARAETATGAEVLKSLIVAYEAARYASKRVTKILELCFQNEPRSVQPMFSRLIGAIVRMRGEQDGPANPAWARGLASMVYRWAFGDDNGDAQQRLRRSLNPNPCGSSVDYGFCTDEGLQHLNRVIQAGEDYAAISSDWADWRSKMEHRFEGRPLQITFMAMIPKLPPGKKGEAA